MILYLKILQSGYDQYFRNSEFFPSTYTHAFSFKMPYWSRIEFKEKTNLSAADDLARMMHANIALINRDWHIQEAHYHTSPDSAFLHTIPLVITKKNI